jgi:outer membrane protein TolC
MTSRIRSSLTLRPLLLALGALVAWGHGPPELVAQQRLTLDEAIELALAYNPGFQATRNEIAVADWDVRSSTANLFLPNLSASTGVSWQGAGEERIGGLTSGQLGLGGQPSVLFSSYSLGVNYS